MILLNSLIMVVLLGFVVRSLIIVIKDMDIKKRQVMNGLILLFVFLIIYISLLTYTPEGDPLENFGGIIGAYIAKSIYQTFGSSAYFLPFILIIASISLFTNRVRRVFYHFGGLFIWLFFIILLVQSILPGVSEIKRGEIGIIAGNFLLGKLTISGSIALILFVFLIVLYIYLYSVLKLKAIPLVRIFSWVIRRKGKEKVIHFNEE